jgi:hypothetical protein
MFFQGFGYCGSFCQNALISVAELTGVFKTLLYVLYHLGSRHFIHCQHGQVCGNRLRELVVGADSAVREGDPGFKGKLYSFFI